MTVQTVPTPESVQAQIEGLLDEFPVLEPVADTGYPLNVQADLLVESGVDVAFAYGVLYGLRSQLQTIQEVSE